MSGMIGFFNTLTGLLQDSQFGPYVLATAFAVFMAVAWYIIALLALSRKSVMLAELVSRKGMALAKLVFRHAQKVYFALDSYLHYSPDMQETQNRVAPYCDLGFSLFLAAIGLFYGVVVALVVYLSGVGVSGGWQQISVSLGFVLVCFVFMRANLASASRAWQKIRNR